MSRSSVQVRQMAHVKGISFFEIQIFFTSNVYVSSIRQNNSNYFKGSLNLIDNQNNSESCKRVDNNPYPKMRQKFNVLLFTIDSNVCFYRMELLVKGFINVVSMLA